MTMQETASGIRLAGRSILRSRLSILLLVVGAVCCLRAGWNVLELQVFQHRPELVLSAHRYLPDGGCGPMRPGLQIVGRIEIPRLHLSTLVVDSDDEGGLALAAGHVAGTAALGSEGNAAIAGHRDGVFSQLRGIKAGDVIHVASGGTSSAYTVKWTQIVTPDTVSVLNPSPGKRRELTLITCYPFRFIGTAPKRFIVRAESL